MRLSVEEAEELADYMEANGNDASQLRVVIAEITRGYSSNVVDALVKQKKMEAEKSVGKCFACHRADQELFAGACSVCFEEWVVSSFEDQLKKKKGRR